MARLRTYLKWLDFDEFRKTIIWQIIKIVVYSTAGFSVTVTSLTYGMLAIKSFVRKRRRFRFPHRSLDEVEVEGHCLKIFNYGQFTFVTVARHFLDEDQMIDC